MIDTDKYEGHLIDKAVEDNSQVWCWSKWLLKNAETIEQHRATAALLSDAPLLLEEVKRLRSVIEDIESMIPDNHEEVSPILSDILSECHRVLPMFNEASE